jgi:ribonuclease P protein component
LFTSLKNSKSFGKILKEGEVVFGRYLVFRHIKSEEEILKIGIITSKKLGNAVIRNKIRRRIRASFISLSSHQENFPKNTEIVILPKKNIAEADFLKIKEDVKKFLLSI